VAIWASLLIVASQPPDFHAYRKTAVQAAEAAHDALRTADLTVDAYLAHKAFGTYVGTVLDDCVSSTSSALGQLTEVPPPDARTAALRDELAPLLDDAAHRLGDVHRAAEADDPAQLRAAKAPLTPLAERIADFLDRHG
jgi:hypothetical protein